jgi:hypothetical protein
MPLSGDIGNYIQQYWHTPYKVRSLHYAEDGAIMCTVAKKQNFLLQQNIPHLTKCPIHKI